MRNRLSSPECDDLPAIEAYQQLFDKLARMKSTLDDLPIRQPQEMGSSYCKVLVLNLAPAFSVNSKERRHEPVPNPFAEAGI